MFNRYLAAVILCCSTTLAQANEEMGLAFNFTSTPGVLLLSTEYCEAPYLAVYTLTNTGHLPITTNPTTDLWLDFQEDDTLDPDAVSYTWIGDNDCEDVGILFQGDSCNIGFNIAPCTAGVLDRSVMVAGLTASRIPVVKLAKGPMVGVVSDSK